MAIRFYNIYRDEELVAENEPQIAALWGTSDRSPNASQGQDMGWRFAPEVVVEMRDIMSDPTKIQQIADRFRMLYEDVGETDVLTWISNKTDLMTAPIATTGDYSEAYQDRIRALERAKKDKVSSATTTATSTESLADMEKRAALAERIAKAESATFVRDTTSTTSKK